MPGTIIVVPCFNEAERLRTDEFARFAAAVPPTGFVMVNDGSTDGTLEILRKLEERDPGRLVVLDLQPNRGKAEAVRAGMRHALRQDCRYAGYWDADLATPLAEIPRFVEVLEERSEYDLVMGSRVRLLGRSIERRPVRHYLGRVFATAASTLLRLPVYDTQCGAKLFRNTAEVAALFEEPFATRWIFEVEFIARWIRARRGGSRPHVAESIYELPLRQWHDVAGSKVRALDFPKAMVELLRIHRRYLR